MAGTPAAGLRIELRRLDPAPGVLTKAVTNADGRTDSPLLGPSEMAAGTSQLEFHVGEYFASKTASSPKVPFFGRLCVPVRFGISDTSASYHVPLLVTPWAYNTYRGS